MSNLYEQKKREWEKHQRLLSWHDRKHEAFLALVAMGDAIVPNILRDIEREPNWIFLALSEIYQDGPDLPDLPDLRDVAGQLRPMCERWVVWGREKGITW